MGNLYKTLHKKYSVSKTLRFELKPIGNTNDNIEKNGVLEKDEDRNTYFKDVKKYCDEYHKKFIDNCLQDFNLNETNLQQYFVLYKKDNKTPEEKENLKSIEGELRKEIADRFKSSIKYKGMFSEKLIKDYLPEMYAGRPELNEIEEFKKFTTYFKGYNTNRENMYKDTADSTAISYRLINENLPIFCSNIKIYDKAKELIPDLKTSIKKDLEDYMQVNSLDDMFKLEYFNDTLTQNEIEVYNIMISGKSNENGEKIKGINEYINEFNQKNKDKKIPKLRQLYKQILSDRIGTSFVIDNIESDDELVESIKVYYENFIKLMYSNNNRKGAIDIILSIDNYDLSKVYINSYVLTDISQKIFENWNTINGLLNDDYDKNYSGKYKLDSEKYVEERKKYFKNLKEYPISYLDDLTDNKISSYIKDYFNNVNNNNETIIEEIEDSYNDIKDPLNKYCDENSKNIVKDKNLVGKIKKLLDNMKSVQEFLKIFVVNDNVSNKDDIFYNSLYELYDGIKDIIPLYNKTRNYLTQKPYSLEKFKINFDNPTLLDGWDVNKEKDNLGVLFLKNGKYYLGIINPYNRKVLENYDFSNDEYKNDGFYRKMEYKLLPGPNKMLPKVFFSKSRIDDFNPSNELIKKYENGYHKKGENFDIDFCHELIDFFKESLNKHEDWKNFNFKFSDTRTYGDLSDFYNEVEQQGYKISFKDYSEKFINDLVEVGDLYLFELYNKDFSEYSKGRKNLHTLYWNEVFDEDNLNNIVYKLNGQAEMFYRKKSLEKNVTHEKNKPIKNKNKLNKKEESIFDYDLIKDKRFTEDKFQLHVPITMNFLNENKNNINEDVNISLKNTDNVNIIGIDRGERNLIYISVINSKEEILEHISLNEIVNEYNGNEYKTNYHELLDSKEKEREKARESWETVNNIKELKEGYLSQVIHKIVEFMDKYNAIIVMEDLNSGFKNSRIKVEKQVYQKFERMLIEKLNYLVFKDKDKFDEGGLLNAYQLTNKFESFNKMGRQNGIIFYVPAWDTSKIDPTTGFVNLFNIKYENIDKSKKFVQDIDDIRFNENENYFELDIDYKKFTSKAYGSINKWTLCTYGDRIKTFRNPDKNNEWDKKRVNLTEEFKELFNKYNINYNDLKQSLLSIDVKDFWEKFMYLFKLMLQMRNSVTGTEEDWIISPVKNKSNKFYLSGEENNLPKDADDNGAYNIARKGLMLVNQIKDTDDEKLNKIKFNITNDEWLKFAQK